MVNNMKHLRKFNESLDNKDEVIEYIKLCFVEFYDKLGEGDNGVFSVGSPVVSVSNTITFIIMDMSV